MTNAKERVVGDAFYAHRCLTIRDDTQHNVLEVVYEPAGLTAFSRKDDEFRVIGPDGEEIGSINGDATIWTSLTCAGTARWKRLRRFGFDERGSLRRRPKRRSNDHTLHGEAASCTVRLNNEAARWDSILARGTPARPYDGPGLPRRPFHIRGHR